MARNELTLEQKKEQLINREYSKQRNPKANNQTVNKGSIAYVSKPNVKAFNSELERRIFFNSNGGRPYAFESLEKLQSDMTEYFNTCREHDIMPTNVSLALWLGCDEDTLTNHANNPTSPYFGVMKNTKKYLHNIMQSGTLSGDINPVTYIFLSKNYYGMKDDKQITVAPTTNTPVNANETMSAIQKQLEQENVSNAEIVSEK